MIRLKVSKTKFSKNVNRHMQKIQIKEIPNSSTQKTRKKRKLKFCLMIGSQVSEHKFVSDHIIFAQSVTEVSIGVLSVIFPLKIIMILKWTIYQQQLLIIGCMFVWHVIKAFQKKKYLAKQSAISFKLKMLPRHCKI